MGRHRPGGRGRRSGLAVVAALAAGGLLLGACSSGPARAHVTIEPEVNFTLPSTAGGCGGNTALAGGAERVPITVSEIAGQVAEMVNVCLGGHGPYPFVLDSGAGESTIDAHLAARLHLPHAGSASGFAGVGCTGTDQPVTAADWSVSGVPLHPQTLTAATLPDFGGRGQPVGLLGSDVLSSFGAVRLDFAARTLTLGGPQGAEPSGSSEVVGPTGPAPSAVLTQGETGTTVPITVMLVLGGTSLDVPVRFGPGPARTFVIDTGSSQSVVASAVARTEHLTHSDLAQRQVTVCSTIVVPLVHSGPWSLPGVTLHQQLVGETGFGPISDGGVEGLLGSDQLIHYGWVIFDYRGGRLVLG
jgi:hypothetical protein